MNNMPYLVGKDEKRGGLYKEGRYQFERELNFPDLKGMRLQVKRACERQVKAELALEESI